MKKKVIGTSRAQGFFSVAKHGGKIFGGEYSREGRVYSYEPWQKVTQLNPGESVYKMLSWKGNIYANTENRGTLFRNWGKVMSDKKWGFGICPFKGALYASFSKPSASIWKSADGKSWVPCVVPDGESKTVRVLVEHDGKLYGVGFDYKRGIGGWYVSRDGVSFEWHDKEPGKRFLGACSHMGQLYISMSPYIGGKRVPPAQVGVGGNVKTIKKDHDRAVGLTIIPHHFGLLWCVMVNWRASSGEGALWLKTLIGRWRKIKFPEPEVKDVCTDGDKVYVATRHERGHGKIYELKIPMWETIF